MDYETRVTAMVVSPRGKAIYEEGVTTIKIEDEAGGEFVVVSQEGDDRGSVAIDPDEWPALRKAIDKLVKECRDA